MAKSKNSARPEPIKPREARSLYRYAQKQAGPLMEEIDAVKVALEKSHRNSIAMQKGKAATEVLTLEEVVMVDTLAQLGANVSGLMSSGCLKFRAPGTVRRRP